MPTYVSLTSACSKCFSPEGYFIVYLIRFRSLQVHDDDGWWLRGHSRPGAYGCCLAAFPHFALSVAVLRNETPRKRFLHISRALEVM